MPVPLILMAAGTAMQMFSQYAANIDQSISEYENAKFFKEQGDAAKSQEMRDLDIADREYEYRKGATIGAEADAGVDVGSGSAVNDIAAVAAAKIRELSAIKLQGELNVKLARMRSTRSQGIANTLSSPSYNVAQGATTLLNNYTKSDGFGTDFSFVKKLDTIGSKWYKKDQNITGAPNKE